MKATGIVRRIDDLGRVAIPKEIRKILHLKDNDTVEFYLEDDKLVLKKYDLLNKDKYETLFNALRKHCKGGIAVYNNTYRLFQIPKYCSCENYPSIVPSDWSAGSNSFKFEDGIVCPIQIEGEIVGYALVELIEDYRGFVEGAITLLTTEEASY